MSDFEVKFKDTITPTCNAVIDAYNRGAHRKIIAHAGAQVYKAHFRKLDLARHTGRTQFHFYARAREATRGTVKNGRATVTINHEGIALRRFGTKGRGLRPRKATYFTIPVDSQSYGRSPREFSNLTWIINRRTKKGVATLGGRVLFALTQFTKHKADPSVLPEDKTVLDRVTDDLKVWTNHLEQKSHG